MLGDRPGPASTPARPLGQLDHDAGPVEEHELAGRGSRKTSFRGRDPVLGARCASIASRSLTRKHTWLKPVRSSVPAPASTPAGG